MKILYFAWLRERLDRGEEDVSPPAEVVTVRDLIALAKKSPGKLVMASGGAGNTGHLGGELFSQLTGGKLVLIPYKGGAAAATDLAAGRISMLLDSQLALQGLQQAGRIRRRIHNQRGGRRIARPQVDVAAARLDRTTLAGRLSRPVAGPGAGAGHPAQRRSRPRCDLAA